MPWGYGAATHTEHAVATTTAQSIAANPNRKYLLLVNDSDQIIYLGLSVAAVLNKGIRLNASGGSYEMSFLLGNLFTGAVNAIHAGVGTKNMMMTEGV